MSGVFHVERVKGISERFDVIQEIGGGTYGVVLKSQDCKTKEIVAVKRIKDLQPGEGFPHSTLREANLLKSLSHDNIVQIKAVVQSEEEREKGLYLVFEYCEYDMYALLHCCGVAKIDTVIMKSLMKQFLVGLHFLAVKHVVHRDLKPANMFVTKDGILKLGDFGLARTLGGRGKMTDKVITLWYRPPELLMGCTKYGPEVDIWSAGCILFEMATSKVLFQASDGKEMSTLIHIFQVCGKPTPETWPDFERRYGKSYAMSLIRMDGLRSESILPQIFKDNIPSEYEGLSDLLMKMIVLNPARRISAEEALNHPFFKNMKSETDPDHLPKITREEMHERFASQKKKEASQRERREMQRTRPQHVTE